MMREVEALCLGRWVRRSRNSSGMLLTPVLFSLCAMTFLALRALRGSSLDPFAGAVPPFRLTRTYLRNLTDLNGNTTNASDPDAIYENRTVLPDDCFHGLLRLVDPTCDLGLFCTEAWRQEDVLCHVFLHQAALIPGPAQCDLPTGKSKIASKVKETKDDIGSKKVKDAEIVPRLAYYVLVSESCENPFSFLFLHYLSVLSVQRFLRPYAIYILGNCVPVGYWWSRVINDVSTIRFVRRPRPWITKDGKVKWISHLADVIRLQVLLVNGGVYVDTDMILLRSVAPLLRYPLTMGLVDNHTGMGNALILAARGTRFLRDWYSGYRDFRPLHFHHNGMWEAQRLWRRDPSSVHLESRRFYSPNWYEAHLLFQERGRGGGSSSSSSDYDDDDYYDLSNSYAVHIWHRHATVPDSPRHILSLNSTLGAVFRRIYFGHSLID